MVKCVFLCNVFLLVFTVSLFGTDLPQVLQPDTTAYSPAEVAILTQAITHLEKVLDNYTLGPRRTFAPSDWSSRYFAAYTAGILAGMGYKTKLASSPGWPDGIHTWVTVGSPLHGKTAWVPVEAAPAVGHAQPILGRIPPVADSNGEKAFDQRYLGFTTLVNLPPNLPPVARIRPPFSPIAGKPASFLAISSYDPNGNIVLYLWDFGDGTTEVDTGWTTHHVFKKAGLYKMTPTVIDNRGKKGTTDFTLYLMEPKQESNSAPSGGCGGGHLAGDVNPRR